MEIKRNPKKCSVPNITFKFETDEEADEFLENWLNRDKESKTSNNQRTEFMQKIHEKVKAAIGDIGCYADFVPVAQIRTDESRFQNRTNAFSELSADSVAQNYDPNKFDPIVIWKDPNNNKDYVLSGHSRFEGIKRRKEPNIPARYFEGTEAQAIQFARIDANRSANVENLVEDLKAYKLMRDGSIAKKIKPATQTALKNAFKGTHGKLEAYSYLNPEGYFIQALQTENKSAFPYIETKALWIGELRKKYGEVWTNTYEDDCYNFLYNSSSLGLKMKKDEFFEDVQKRISKQELRLYPECNTQECVAMEDLKLRGARGEPYRTLNKNQVDLDIIKERLSTEKRSTRIYTEDERKNIIDVAQRLEKENTQIRKDVNIVEKTEASLFGISGVKNKFMEIKKQLQKCSAPKAIFQFDTDEEVLEFLENWENRDKKIFSMISQNESISGTKSKSKVKTKGMEIKKQLQKCSSPKVIFQFNTDEDLLEFLENWENKDKAVFSANADIDVENETNKKIAKLKKAVSFIERNTTKGNS